MSFLYRLLCGLLGVLIRRGGERELEIIVLRHQLAILSRGGRRPQYTTVDRAVLAAASRLLPPDRWSCFLVSAQTLRRWHRALLLGKRRSGGRRLGRPPLAAETRLLIERLAQENPRWGYMRIQGELNGLAISVSATTVANMLRSAGLGPAPRRIGRSWSQFVRAQAESLLGGGLRAVLAEGLDSDAAAVSRPAADRPASSVEADDGHAPSSHPRSPAHLLPRPSHSLLAPPQGPWRLRPCHRSHARDGPNAHVGAWPRSRGPARHVVTANAAADVPAPTSAAPRAPREAARIFGPRGAGAWITPQARTEFLYPTGLDQPASASAARPAGGGSPAHTAGTRISSSFERRARARAAIPARTDPDNEIGERPKQAALPSTTVNSAERSEPRPPESRGRVCEPYALEAIDGTPILDLKAVMDESREA